MNQSTKILFIGDINVDLIFGGLLSPPALDREVTCVSYEETLGSTAVICACAYSSLGGAAYFMGLAGKDEYGDFMLQGMHEFGIDTELVDRTSEIQTGVTVNLIYRQTRSQVTFPGTIAEFDGDRIDEALLARFDHLHLAGPYQQASFRPRIAEVLELARQCELGTSLDPQWDPEEKWQGMDEWSTLLDYLFLNEDEALSFTKKSSPVEALKELNQRGSFPVIKLGDRGALAIIKDRVHQVRAKKIDVVDTTGAGDSFDAAFLYGRLEKGMNLEESLEFANAAAARSCLFSGGVRAESSFDQVIEFMHTVK